MTTARTEALDAMAHLPAGGDAAQILQWALVEQRSTCEIAKILGISELEAETRYQQALVDLQRQRRRDVDGMLLVWDGREGTGKARFGGVSLELDRTPDVGIGRLRHLHMMPGRIAEVRVSGAAARLMTTAEMARALAWLRTMARELRAASRHLMVATESPTTTAPMPLTDWPPLDHPPAPPRSTP